MATALNGKKIAQGIKKELKAQIKKLSFRPGLAAILINEDPASQLYLRLKNKACQDLGIYFKQFSLPEKTQSAKVLDLIEGLNQDPQITGILIQLPLPRGWETDKLIKAISFQKDVDGLWQKSLVQPPVIEAICRLLEETGLSFVDKKAVCLVNSQVFGKKLVGVLAQKGIKAHFYLPGQETLERFQGADILISIRGKPHFIKSPMVRKGVVLIDAGSLLKKGKFLGDIDPGAYKKTSFFSPVPGGVGPLTVAFLLKNLVDLTKKEAIK